MVTEEPVLPPLWQLATQRGLTAARRNLVPGLLLSLFASALVVAYYQVPVVAAFFNAIVALREAVGLPFGMISTAFFGGVLPLLVRRGLLGERPGRGETVFAVLFWAYKGLEVGALYEVQAWIWGTGTDVATLAGKVAVDQLIYAPLLAVPNMVLGYLWMAQGFRFRRLREALRKEGYWSRALPVLITNACLWVPAVIVIYLFPTALQLPLQNLVLAFWVLLLAVLARRDSAGAA